MKKTKNTRSYTKRYENNWCLTYFCHLKFLISVKCSKKKFLKIMIFKYITNSNFWHQILLGRPSPKWLDMSHLLSIRSENQGRVELGAGTPPPPSACNRPVHTMCDMSSHLGEGRYKIIWCQKFKIVMHMEILNFCQI